jgi:hypothetical protein
VTNLITAVAASAAALFSLVNVFLSSYLGRTSQVRQWRRESVRKTMADVLNVTRALADDYSALAELYDVKAGTSPPVGRETSEVTSDELTTAAHKADATRIRLKNLLGELELAASSSCASAGMKLYETLDQSMRMATRPGGPDDKSHVVAQLMTHVDAARELFLSECRADLGVSDTRRRWSSSKPSTSWRSG